MNKEARYLLSSIVESSQDSIVSIDLERVVTSWNKSAEILYGYAADEVIGKPLSVVMLPKDIQDLIDKVNSIVHDMTIPIFDTVRLHKNGRTADLEILLSPVRDSGGNVIGISTIARDISLRKMQEQQKDEFISIASHELRTPVTSIKAYAEIILEQLELSGDEAATSLVRKLDHQVDKLIDLIRTLLDTTKLAAGEIILHVEQFDMNSLINEQLEVLRMLSARHTFTFDAGKLRSVPADRKLIGRVFTNLISNAIKYSPQGGEISITSLESDHGAQVSVRDRGIGIPEEDRQKIFGRYFRVSHPTVASASGIGLGLYISAGIVNQHGGTMSVDSEPGRGSTFAFTLPYDVQ